MTTPTESVAATLRFLAGGWVELSDADRQWCAEKAVEIEHHDFTDSWCCPLCEEVECDDDCPLRGQRSGRESVTSRSGG